MTSDIKLCYKRIKDRQQFTKHGIFRMVNTFLLPILDNVLYNVHEYQFQMHNGFSGKLRL